MDKVFAVVKGGIVEIINERGYYTGKRLCGGDWVSAVVNGDTIMATKKDGTVQFFDLNGNYKGHA